MGADIHWYLEARNAAGSWDCIALQAHTPLSSHTGEDMRPRGKEKELLAKLRNIYRDKKIAYLEEMKKRSHQADDPDGEYGEWTKRLADEIETPESSEGIGNRNYRLFSALARVRSRDGDVWIKEGAHKLSDVVTDPSLLVKINARRWDADAHSYVVYTLFELEQHFGPSDGSDAHIARVLIRVVNNDEWDWSEDMIDFVARMRKIADEEYGGDATALRLICWWDN